MGMVLNLVNSPEAEVGGSHCLLHPKGELYDWDEERSRGDLQNLQG